MGFVPLYIAGRDADWAAGNDGQTVGLVWALASLATNAVAEIDRLAGEHGLWLFGQRRSASAFLEHGFVVFAVFGFLNGSGAEHARGQHPRRQLANEAAGSSRNQTQIQTQLCQTRCEREVIACRVKMN